jgi:hypothetical protein
MIGRWIRIKDRGLTDELGWHRVKSAEDVAGDIDGRQRLELCCHVVVLVNPMTLERGMPGAGAVICDLCAKWKDEE